MSIFSKIISAEHTFAAWAEKELAKIYSTAPAIEKIASAVLKYVGPALQLIVTAEAGSTAGATVAAVVAEAQTSLTAASSLIYDFGASPTVASVVSSVTENLSGLLTAGHITSATSVGIANKVVSNLTALSTALSTTATA